MFWLIKVEEDLTEGLLLANIPDHKTFFKGNRLLNGCLFPLCYMHVHFHYAYWIGYTHQGFGHLNAYLWDTGECWKKLKHWRTQGRIIWSMCVVTFWRNLLKHSLEQPCVADLPVNWTRTFPEVPSDLSFVIMWLWGRKEVLSAFGSQNQTHMPNWLCWS